MTSRLNPRRSVQRRYMRNSISAQSCDSVPPAPGWIVTMAFLRSSSPESIVRISPAWMSRPYVSSPRSRSAGRPRPAAPSRRAPQGRRPACAAPPRARGRPRAGGAAAGRFCALAWSFQKSGAEDCGLDLGQLPRERASSKPPPQVGGASGEVACMRTSSSSVMVISNCPPSHDLAGRRQAGQPRPSRWPRATSTRRRRPARL